jgi:hypothetical protein
MEGKGAKIYPNADDALKGMPKDGMLIAAGSISFLAARRFLLGGRHDFVN